MCTSAEAASHGHDSRTGAGSQTAMANAISAEPTESATVSSCLSAEPLRSAFQPACRTAAPSTASVTGSVSSIRLADHLLDERRHALHRRAAFGDGFLRAVVLHGAEV